MHRSSVLGCKAPQGVIAFLQERWETPGAEYVQSAAGKAPAAGIKVHASAAGGGDATTSGAGEAGDTEKENEHRVSAASALCLAREALDLAVTRAGVQKPTTCTVAPP